MKDSGKWFVLAGTLTLGFLLYLLAPVLTPFLIAAALAYIGDPLVDRLEAWGLSRTLSVVSVFFLLTLAGLTVLLVLVPMVQRQVVILTANLPAYIDWVQHQALPWLAAKLGFETDVFDLEVLRAHFQESWRNAGGSMAQAVAALSKSGLTVLAWLANLVLIPVVTFYLLRDWDVMVARIRELVPRRIEPEVVRLARASDEVLGAFMRGQLMVMLALGTVYSAGLWMVGLDLALLIGMLAGVVSFVPYLGFIVGIVVAGVAALMQFQDGIHLIYVAAVFGVGQLLEGMVLTPLLLGERIGLHPVAVIFAVLAGGQLFGFFGVLLALPVAAVVMVLLRYAHERYVDSRIYGEAQVGVESGAEET